MKLCWIEPPAGYVSSEATHISPEGRYVVGAVKRNIAEWDAFIWSEHSGLHIIADLPAGFSRSYAYGVSAEGKVVVGEVKGGAKSCAFLWTEKSGIQLLIDPSLPVSSWAYGVSEDGTVVVGFVKDDFGQRRVFRWDAKTNNLQIISDIWSRAWRVSLDGSTIVGETEIMGTRHAFYWTEREGFKIINIPSAYVHAEARALSADGSLIAVNIFSELGEAKVFVYDKKNHRVEQLDTGKTLPNFSAVGMSADGKVVVGAAFSAPTLQQLPPRSFAVQWRAGEGVRILNNVCKSLLKETETLTSATAVSACGGFIAGWGGAPLVGARAFWLRLPP